MYKSENGRIKIEFCKKIEEILKNHLTKEIECGKLFATTKLRGKTDMMFAFAAYYYYYYYYVS